MVANDVIEDVSLVSLISDGKKFNGKNIRVIGVLSSSFESEFVFLNKESKVFFITTNAIKLDFGTKSTDKYKHFEGKYVVIEGVFNYLIDELDKPYTGIISNISFVGRFE